MTNRADIFLCIPTADGTMTQETYNSLKGVYRNTMSKGWTIAESLRRGSDICRAREESVVEAIAMSAKWLMFIDSDMRFPDHTITRMINCDVDIVSALAFAKQPPFPPLAARFDKDRSLVPINEWPEDERIEVDGVGAGMLLIKLSVFESIKPPYFLFSVDKNGRRIGEDYYFSHKVRTAGIKITLDTGLLVDHMGTYPYGIIDHKNYKWLMEQKEANAKDERKRAS